MNAIKASQTATGTGSKASSTSTTRCGVRTRASRSPRSAKTLWFGWATRETKSRAS